MNSVATAFLHLNSNYMFQTSNYVLYVWDHIITFSDEVEKIWSQPFTFGTLLFYINRYMTHAQFIILQVEFHETSWPISVCDRYVKFAGAATLCLVAVAELSLILRVHALYLGKKWVLVFLLPVLVAQICFSAYAVHTGRRVPLPEGFPGCVLTGTNQWMSALWAAPLFTDACIFFLTLWRTARYYRKKHAHMSTVQLVLRDGTIYFAVIFSANLMNTFIYFLAPEDLKAMGASFSQILTAIMISRLQLNLRRVSRPFESSVYPPDRSGPIEFGARHTPHHAASDKDTETTFFSIGNLGDELHGSFFEAALYGDSSTESSFVDRRQRRFDSQADIELPNMPSKGYLHGEGKQFL